MQFMYQYLNLFIALLFSFDCCAHSLLSQACFILAKVHVKNFMASMNMPSPCHKTMKKKERQAGAVVECLAKESCAKAIEEEKVQTMKGKAEEADRDKKNLAMPNEVTAAPSSSPSTLTDLHNECCFICKKSVPSTLCTCSSCALVVT